MPTPSPRRAAAGIAALAAFALLALTACGQTGPLYLPGPDEERGGMTLAAGDAAAAVDSTVAIDSTAAD